VQDLQRRIVDYVKGIKGPVTSASLAVELVSPKPLDNQRSFVVWLALE
jgi:hypothetical protein